MEEQTDKADPLAIEELIKQALAEKKRWRKPSNELDGHVRAKSWKELLEGRTSPKVSGSRQS
jgi:hypothetical protein